MNRFSRTAVGLLSTGALAIAGLIAMGAARQPLNFYHQHNLVSDGTIRADHTDPNLANAWGLQFNPTGPWWVADNKTGVSTLYDAAGVANPLVVTVPPPVGQDPPGAPTGIVFFGGIGFLVSDGVNIAPARFIFATEAGTIAAWAPTVPPPAPSTHAFTVYPAPGDAPSGAVYKGLAVANDADFLYATDFHNGRIDIFDTSFHKMTLPGNFTDPHLPPRFAPFGIRNINNVLYVTYAKQDADAHDDVAGAGHGIVDAFDQNGHFLRRVITGGRLNSPWGLALAPRNFGRFSGDLLVGNFGDGRINAYDPINGNFRGTLMSPRGRPIEIDGLWALSFGNGNVAGPTNTLFFTAGPADEQHGLFGRITAVPNGSGHDRDDEDSDRGHR